jgi:hypothetical protein
MREENELLMRSNVATRAIPAPSHQIFAAMIGPIAAGLASSIANLADYVRP